MATYRYGKHPTKNDYRSLLLKNYLKPQLSPPPESVDLLAKVYRNLNVSDPSALFPMDNNSKYGDCTIAAVAHAITVYRGLVKQSKIMGVDDVLKVYRHLTGGLDSGLPELDVLNYWRSVGIASEKIYAFVKVGARDLDHVKQAINLFGGVYLGFQVQENCQEDFEARKPWTPGRLTHDGHAVYAVYAVAYDKQYVTVLTWGRDQKATWGWWEACVDEAYAILPPEAETKGFDPGLDFDALKADLKLVAN